MNSIDETNTIAMSAKESAFVPLALFIIAPAIESKKPDALSPSDIPISEKSIASVLKSMASIHAADGGLKNADITAAAAAITNTISLFRKPFISLVMIAIWHSRFKISSHFSSILP